MAIAKTTQAKIKLIGMFLVLCTAGWQLFVLQPLTSAQSSGREFERDLKLDAMWGVLGDLHRKEFPDRTNVLSGASVDAIDKTWESALTKRFDRLDRQANAANYMAAFLFFVGSCMIVFAKWAEVQRDRNSSD